jgi:hypothetical protein
MGLNLGGLLKTLAPVALTVMTGGAAAPALLNMAIKMAAQIAIQKLGAELGLPPVLVNAAAMAVTGGAQGPGGPVDFGQFLQSQGFSGAEAGMAMRALDGVQSGLLPLARDLMQSGVLDSNDSAFTFADRFSAGVGSDNRIIQSQKNVDQLRDLRDQQRLNNDNKAADKTDLKLEKASEQHRKLINSALEITLREGRDKTKEKMRLALQSTKSPIMRLAMIMGMIADMKSNEMMKRAEAIGQFGEVKTKNQAEFQQLSTELNAVGQELSTLIQAAANVIKTMGEASASMARKG